MPYQEKTLTLHIKKKIYLKVNNWFDHRHMIPVLKTFVWLLGLLCATYGFVVCPEESDEHRPILISILSGYGIILFESMVSFVDIAQREDDRVFKASVFWILAVIVFHFATTFPFTYVLYVQTTWSDSFFTICTIGLIAYVTFYKWFVEFIDKNLNLWTATFKVRTVCSKM